VSINICSQTNSVQSVTHNYNGSYTLTMVGTPGAQYYVVSSGVIEAPLADWTPVMGSTNTVGADGTWSCVVSNPTPAYYRPVAVHPAP
jgi:hypothetical protein